MTKAESREWVERRVAREWLMRFLYSLDVQKMETQDLDDWFCVFDARNDTEEEAPFAAADGEEHADPWPVKEEAHHLRAGQKTFIRNGAKSVLDNLEEIDEHIVRHLKGWEYTRLPKVDRAILRMAVAEILYLEEIPVGASINEAVELSKRYSSDTSFRFLNGVLGNIAREVEES